jgi:hypothetical protein
MFMIINTHTKKKKKYKNTKNYALQLRESLKSIKESLWHETKQTVQVSVLLNTLFFFFFTQYSFFKCACVF